MWKDWFWLHRTLEEADHKTTFDTGIADRTNTGYRNLISEQKSKTPDNYIVECVRACVRACWCEFLRRACFSARSCPCMCAYVCVHVRACLFALYVLVCAYIFVRRAYVRLFKSLFINYLACYNEMIAITCEMERRKTIFMTSMQVRRSESRKHFFHIGIAC